MFDETRPCRADDGNTDMTQWHRLTDWQVNRYCQVTTMGAV